MSISEIRPCENFRSRQEIKSVLSLSPLSTKAHATRELDVISNFNFGDRDGAEARDDSAVGWLVVPATPSAARCAANKAALRRRIA